MNAPRNSFAYTAIYSLCRVNSEAIDLASSTSLARDRVYVALARRANLMGRFSLTPTRRAEIARECGITASTFRNALHDLVCKGDIRRLGRDVREGVAA